MYDDDKKYPTNKDPFKPWNSIMYRNDPFAPWNDSMKKKDPFACWNNPFGSGQYENEVKAKYK